MAYSMALKLFEAVFMAGQAVASNVGRADVLSRAMDDFAETPDILRSAIDGVPDIAAIINTGDANGTTALHKAAIMLNPGLVQILLDLAGARDCRRIRYPVSVSSLSFYKVHRFGLSLLAFGRTKQRRREAEVTVSVGFVSAPPLPVVPLQVEPWLQTRSYTVNPAFKRL